VTDWPNARLLDNPAAGVEQLPSAGGALDSGPIAAAPATAADDELVRELDEVVRWCGGAERCGDACR
jgi:hypothetical protein